MLANKQRREARLESLSKRIRSIRWRSLSFSQVFVFFLKADYFRSNLQFQSIWMTMNRQLTIHKQNLTTYD